MVDATLIHALGESGASQAYVSAIMAGEPNDARNHALRLAKTEQTYAERAFRPPPNFPALRALWDGHVEQAYREADANLAIVLEAAFSPQELGLPEVSCVKHDYDMLTTH